MPASPSETSKQTGFGSPAYVVASISMMLSYTPNNLRRNPLELSVTSPLAAIGHALALPVLALGVPPPEGRIPAPPLPASCRFELVPPIPVTPRRGWRCRCGLYRGHLLGESWQGQGEHGQRYDHRKQQLHNVPPLGRLSCAALCRL